MTRVRNAIRQITMRKAKEIAETCLKFENSRDCVEYLEQQLAHCVAKLW